MGTQFQALKPTQEQYDDDHSAIMGEIAAIKAQVAQNSRAVAPRTPGTRIPYSGTGQAGGFSPAAPSSSTTTNGGIIVSDGTTAFPGVGTIIFPGWTVTVSGGGATVEPDFSGIDDS